MRLLAGREWKLDNENYYSDKSLMENRNEYMIDLNLRISTRDSAKPCL